MEKVEYRIGFYGKATIHLDERNIVYECGVTDISNIFNNLLGHRIQFQYSQGYTIFKLGTKQVDKIIKYFKDKTES